MTFDELIIAALAAPPGSIMYAKQLTQVDSKTLEKTDFELQSVNGQKPGEA
jgi:hypothetical protein